MASANFFTAPFSTTFVTGSERRPINRSKDVLILRTFRIPVARLHLAHSTSPAPQSAPGSGVGSICSQSLAQSLRREKDERAANGEEQFVETSDDEIRGRRSLGTRVVRGGHDGAPEKDAHDESYRYVSQCASPDTTPDPSECSSEARVLDRLED